MGKFIFVMGPEGSGSLLISQIIAHALGVAEYGTWLGGGAVTDGGHKVEHHSLPRHKSPVFPDPSTVAASHRHYDERYFVLTTRDITLSELSRQERIRRTPEECREHSDRARDIMLWVMGGVGYDYQYFLWSYETFMFLGKPYLDLLYQFLGVTSDFIPSLYDGNKRRIER